MTMHIFGGLCDSARWMLSRDTAVSLMGLCSAIKQAQDQTHICPELTGACAEFLASSQSPELTTTLYFTFTAT